jgi:D-aspartate ligase
LDIFIDELFRNRRKKPALKMEANNNQNLSVLIPDGESHILIFIVNCLSLNKNVKIFVMSSEKASHMRYSRLIKKYSYYPKSSDLDWINNIDSEIKKHSINIILPIFEIGIKRIIENQKVLKNKNKLCFLPSLKDFNLARNKGLFYSHLVAHQLPCPKSIIVKPKMLPDFNNLRFPIIIKPVEGYGGGIGVEVLNSSEDVIMYYQKNFFECDTIIQSYINGFDICSNILCKNGHILAYSNQKGNLYGKGELSPQIGFDFVEDENLFKSTKKLMKSLNWSGVANIDWRYDQDDKQFKVIEINTRFWLNTEASAIAGVNFPYLYCLSSLNIKFKIQHANSMSYLNLKGLVYQIKKNPLLIFNIDYLFKNTPLSFALKDPIPMIYKYVSRTKNIIVSRLLKNK